MNKYIRNTLSAFLGAAFVFSVIGAPLASAHAVNKPGIVHKQEKSKKPVRKNAQTTVRSYDMDEYLDMLLATGQYDKYDRFAQIALPDAYAKHIANYSYWRNGYPARAFLSTPLQAAKADAAQYGFNANADRFTLVSQSASKAVVKIVHSGKTYYANMLKSNSGWYMDSVYRLK